MNNLGFLLKTIFMSGVLITWGFLAYKHFINPYEIEGTLSKKRIEASFINVDESMLEVLKDKWAYEEVWLPSEETLGKELLLEEADKNYYK